MRSMSLFVCSLHKTSSISHPLPRFSETHLKSSECISITFCEVKNVWKISIRPRKDWPDINKWIHHSALHTGKDQIECIPLQNYWHPPRSVPASKQKFTRRNAVTLDRSITMCARQRISHRNPLIKVRSGMTNTIYLRFYSQVRYENRSINAMETEIRAQFFCTCEDSSMLLVQSGLPAGSHSSSPHTDALSDPLPSLFKQKHFGRGKEKHLVTFRGNGKVGLQITAWTVE